MFSMRVSELVQPGLLPLSLKTGVSIYMVENAWYCSGIIHVAFVTQKPRYAKK